jgi:anti-sigma regulatory factor (Ser/Thr protein kinase)
MVCSADCAATGAFEHEALFYDGFDGFVEDVGRFLAEGVSAGEPALVVAAMRKNDALREYLGGDAAHVQFADMAEVGRNPARIIPAWTAFVGKQSGSGRRFRGVGEPIYPERTAPELVECQHHESLLNVAFAEGPGWSLVCPYDTSALPEDVIDEAMRSHPAVVRAGVRSPSAAYPGHGAAQPLSTSLPPPPQDASWREFGLDELYDVRRTTMSTARSMGLGHDDATDLTLAVNEVAGNSIRHSGGRGRIRMWRAADTVVADVADDGRIDDPLVGRRVPHALQEGGYGLLIANRLCELVQIRSGEAGTVVRLHKRVSAEE